MANANANVELDVEALRRIRGSIKTSVTTTQTWLDKKTEKSVREAQLRRTHLIKRYEEFLEINNRLISIDPTESDDYYIEVEDQYLTLLARFEELIPSESQNVVPQVDQSHHSDQDLDNQSQCSSTASSNKQYSSRKYVASKLPKRKLPEFHGKAEEWPSFYQRFENLLDREECTDLDRFEFLLDCLKDGSDKDIENIPVLGENYEEAISILRRRYENKRLNMRSYLQKLFRLPNVSENDASSLRTLINTVTSNIRALENLGYTRDTLTNELLAQLIVTKLDTKNKELWEVQLTTGEETSDDTDTYVELIEFLENRLRVTASVYSSNPAPAKKGNKPDNITASVQKSQPRPTTVLATSVNSSDSTENVRKCPHCTEAHALYQCSEFRRLTVPERYDKVRDLKLCVNCFGGKHWAKDCKSIKCKLCSRAHHTLLHPVKAATNASPAAVASPSETAAAAAVVSNAASTTTNSSSRSPVSQSRSVTSMSSLLNSQLRDVLLATARIEVSSDHCTLAATAMLDGGSHASFISTGLCQRIGSSVVDVAASVSGFGGSSAAVNKLTSVTVSSRDFEFSVPISALITSRITDPLPPTSFDIQPGWSFLQSYQLADPEFNQRKDVDILLGADVLYEILLPEFIKTANAPTLQASRLGWLVVGPYATSTFSTHHCLRTTVSSTAEIESLTRFWELEDLPSRVKVSDGDAQAEKHFQSTFQRVNGRFSVRLPFRDARRPSETRQLAIARLRRVQITEQYEHFMNEYLALGHMRRTEASPSPSYYIPHHAVYREGKIRVVFDASMKSTNGLSLNDCLLTGPTLQSTVFDILLKFRSHCIAFTSDICKMYRQFRIHDDDQRWQKIVWFENGQLVDFSLTTVTYGLSCAPYLAIRCLLQLANDGRISHPEAAAALEEDSYVDDIVTGADSSPEAILLRDQLIDLLASAGMTLDKWHSNSPSVLPNESLTQPSATTKVLGVVWNTEQDNLSISAPSSPSQTCTKRILSSFLSSFYDPLGLIAPITLTGKLILQSIWSQGADWDDLLDDPTARLFSQFVDTSQTITDCRIPRYLGIAPNQPFELHGFVDASNRAYAACIYVRVRLPDSRIFTTLICAKTRLVPQRIKRTIPELELCAAHLLTELFESTSKLLKYPLEQCSAYSDSTVVLAYLAKEPHTWKVFVANRVRKITAVIPRTRWQHVPGEENPADIATRPQTRTTFEQRRNLWINGPSFLQSPTLPIFKEPDFDESTLSYLRSKPMTTLVSNVRPAPFELAFNRFSSYTRLVRAVGYACRYLLALRARVTHSPPPTGPLTASELDFAEQKIFTLVQAQTFADEISRLKNSVPLKSKSSLLSLNPFIDPHGLLRVGGRLENTTLPFDQRHPIILPVHHHVTKILLRDLHRQYRHAGLRFLTATLQRRFHFVGHLAQAIQKCIRTCVRCIRSSAQTATVPPMGQLPADRSVPDFPFANVGVDYAGPILTKPNVRCRSATRVKSYIAVFVCMPTKAVHLEVVSDLSTPAFLAAFQRFVARRGLPHTVHSDNGTNFTSAAAELDRQFDNLLKADDFQSYLATNRIQWKFNPPSAPHMGGLWEAAVKSLKFHLRRSIGEQILTFEELTTVTCHVESILNSRPLTPLHPGTVDALTPAHLLIGRPLIAIPETTNPTIRLSQRWRLLNEIRRSLWTRWSEEYLITLQRRNKWRETSRPFQIGDIVLIRDESTAPLSWPLAMITAVYPGKDGYIRVVDVRTKNSTTFRRPVAKLVLLPTPDDSD